MVSSHRGDLIGPTAREGKTSARFATAEDYGVCRKLHKLKGPTYYLATLRFPREIRRRTHAVYAFVRVVDDWVDEPSPGSDPAADIAAYRCELVRGMEGSRPTSPILRAFCDVLLDTEMSFEEPLRFLDAMESDLRVTRYRTYEDLRAYIRGSAGTVGIMMLAAMGAGTGFSLNANAQKLAEAMQLSNFLRDVRDDARRGRIYLPLKDLSDYGVSESDILEGRSTGNMRKLINSEVSRARELYRSAEVGISLLPPKVQKAVRLAANLYERLIDQIEARGFDVFPTHCDPDSKIT